MSFVADRSSFVDRPFGVPLDIEVHLPTPPSVNRIWRSSKAGKNQVSLAQEYRDWIAAADKLAISMAALRGIKKIRTSFEAHIILKKCRGDLDNRIKGVLDWAQSRELIRNDSDCVKLLVEYGDAPHGCRLILRVVAP